MTKTVARTRRTAEPALDVVGTFQQHLVLKNEAKSITTRSEALKKRLKEWLPGAKGVYRSESGSYFYDLARTLVVGGRSYKGMELRRSASVKFDVDVAEAICKRKKIDPDLYTVRVVDQDKIARLQQEGVLTEKDLDRMFVESESYAFWPVEGEV